MVYTAIMSIFIWTVMDYIYFFMVGVNTIEPHPKKSEISVPHAGRTKRT